VLGIQGWKVWARGEGDARCPETRGTSAGPRARRKSTPAAASPVFTRPTQLVMCAAHGRTFHSDTMAHQFRVVVVLSKTPGFRVKPMGARPSLRIDEKNPLNLVPGYPGPGGTMTTDVLAVGPPPSRFDKGEDWGNGIPARKIVPGPRLVFRFYAGRESAPYRRTGPYRRWNRGTPGRSTRLAED